MKAGYKSVAREKRHRSFLVLNEDCVPLTLAGSSLATRLSADDRHMFLNAFIGRHRQERAALEFGRKVTARKHTGAFLAGDMDGRLSMIAAVARWTSRGTSSVQGLAQVPREKASADGGQVEIDRVGDTPGARSRRRGIRHSPTHPRRGARRSVLVSDVIDVVERERHRLAAVGGFRIGAREERMA